MNTDDTPLLPHGGYRKLRSYPDEIRRHEDYTGQFPALRRFRPEEFCSLRHIRK